MIKIFYNIFIWEIKTIRNYKNYLENNLLMKLNQECFNNNLFYLCLIIINKINISHQIIFLMFIQLM